MTLQAQIGPQFSAFVQQHAQALIEIFSGTSEIEKLQSIMGVVDQSSRSMTHIKSATSGLLDERGPKNPNDPVGWNAPAKAGSFAFDRVALTMQRFAFGHVTFSNHDLSEGSAQGADLISEWTRVFAEQAVSISLRRVGVLLGDNANYIAGNTSSSLDLTIPNAALVASVNAALATMRGNGIRTSDLVAVCSDTVVDALMQQDELRDTTSIAIGVLSGGVQRRTGSLTRDQVASWFQAKFGIELFEFQTRTIRSNGTPTPVLDDDLYLVQRSGLSTSSFLLRGDHPDATDAGTVVAYDVKNPMGTAMYIDHVFGSTVSDGRLGFRFSGVI